MIVHLTCGCDPHHALVITQVTLQRPLLRRAQHSEVRRSISTWMSTKNKIDREEFGMPLEWCLADMKNSRYGRPNC